MKKDFSITDVSDQSLWLGLCGAAKIWVGERNRESKKARKKAKQQQNIHNEYFRVFFLFFQHTYPLLGKIDFFSVMNFEQTRTLTSFFVENISGNPNQTRPNFNLKTSEAHKIRC